VSSGAKPEWLKMLPLTGSLRRLRRHPAVKPRAAA